MGTKYYIIYRKTKNPFMLDYLEFLVCTTNKKKAKDTFDLLTEHPYKYVNFCVEYYKLIEFDITKTDAAVAGHLLMCMTSNTIFTSAPEYSLLTEDESGLFKTLKEVKILN